MIEPIFFRPNYKKMVWGGNNIKNYFNRDMEDSENIGESWEISAHKNGLSEIVNSSFDNENLYELFCNKSRRQEIFGNKCMEMERFPILAKFIDAQTNLSIQVHPDDEYAKKYENDSGKNEVWYIMDCKDDAKIVYGLKDNVTQEDLKSAINNIEDNVKYINIKKGDFITIPAGTIHAICGGVMLCEIQQSSDITYRVYDWGRVGFDGKPRQLHTNKALDVIKVRSTAPVHNYYDFSDTETIYNSDCFKIDLMNIKENLTTTSNEDSFNAYIVLDGEGKIESNGFEKNIVKGTSFLIPAKLGSYTLKGNLKLLKVYM